MAKRNNTVRKPRKPARSLPDLHALIDAFTQVRAVVACVVRSLDELQDPHFIDDPRTARSGGDEAITLRHGLTLLDAAVRALDAADRQLHSGVEP